MITLEQRKLLKRINENLLNQLLKYENKAEDERNVTILKSKTNDDTLKLTLESKEVFFHSKYNPLREAETFAEEYLDLSAYKHVLFIGTGLGYHIDLILAANPHLKYSIFEPNPEILFHFLNRDNAKSLKLSKIINIFSDIGQIKDVNLFSDKYLDDTITISWNVTKQFYSEQIEQFQKTLVQIIKSKRNDMAVNFDFQHLWTLNALDNLQLILQTPNILLDIKTEAFENKPVILVAAGPSLSYEWDNLKMIKDKGLAYIFAVGSAINGLIENDILPDAFFTYDPTYLNTKVVAKLKERGIENVPVVFGSTVASAVLKGLKTPLLHFITSQDKLTPFMLDEVELPIIFDAPTISIVTYQIVAALKASHVILVGQNLGYVDNKVYADGIKYSHVNETLTENQIQKLIPIEDVEGNKIGTSKSFDSMRNGLENCIEIYKQITPINTTRKGANIKGAPFMPLERVISEILTVENIVNRGWYEGGNQYDKEKIGNKKGLLINEVKKMEVALKAAVADISKINDLYNKKVLTNIESHLDRFDKSLFKIYENEFFKRIILPTMQNQKNVFSNRSSEVKLEKNLQKKIHLFNEIFVKFIESVYASYLIVQPHLNSLSIEKTNHEESK